ncbi:MAG: caspase family protein [Nitrospirae bacterium]|nr:caspase family protein [Nitrospirota bacterium]MBF0591435.1 caspase family protein [Nitrospirota bacterium]
MLRGFIGSLVLVGLVCMPVISYAKRYAVLIGISEYKEVNMLEGPVNDVRDVRDMLVRDYRFASNNVKTLINEEATKDSIMKSLKHLKNNTRAGDFIFIYFSGHGTSSYDDVLNNPPIGNSTGALVPYDFYADKNDMDKLISSLIIGRRDIKPIISELDRDRKLFVVFDSCFSGNTVRSVRKPAGISKYLPIGALKDKHVSPFTQRRNEPYPYRNTIYISASNEEYTASDLGGGTFDNRPHGVLTNAIIKGLGGKGLKAEADTNNDGIVTYEELYNYVKKDTNNHNQIPQLLRHADMAINIPVFEGRAAVNKPHPGGIVSSKGNLRVKLENKSISSPIGVKLKPLNGVELAKDNYDLLITKEEEGPYSIYLPSGDRLYNASSVDDAVRRVARYVKVRELVTLANQGQRFNVFLKVGSGDDKAVFSNGELLDFTIKSEEDVYVVLLNVDAKGFVTVLLPESNSPFAHVSEGVAREFKELGNITPPLGSEFMKVFAFRNKVDGFIGFAGKTIDPSSDDFVTLFDLIKAQKDWAEATHQIVTVTSAK